MKNIYRFSSSSLQRLTKYYEVGDIKSVARLYDTLQPVTCPLLVDKFMEVFSTSGMSTNNVALYQSFNHTNLCMNNQRAHWLISSFVSAGNLPGASDYFLGIFGTESNNISLIPLSSTYELLIEAYANKDDVASTQELINDALKRNVEINSTTSKSNLLRDIILLKPSLDIQITDYSHTQRISDYNNHRRTITKAFPKIFDELFSSQSDTQQTDIYDIMTNHLLSHGRYIEAGHVLEHVLLDGIIPKSSLISTIFVNNSIQKDWFCAFMTFKRVFKPALRNPNSLNTFCIPDSDWIESYMMQCLVLLYKSEPSRHFQRDDTFYILSNDNENVYILHFKSVLMNVNQIEIPIDLCDIEDASLRDFLYCVIRLCDLNDYWKLKRNIIQDLNDKGIIFSNTLYINKFLN